MGRKGFRGIVVAALALMPAVRAQEQTITLPPIVVSPTGVPTTVNEIASSVTTITGEEMQQQQIRTVPDALRTVPGLDVVQTGGPGGQTSVFIRGTNANHVKVLIDGIDVSDPSVNNGAFDFAHLLTGDIERIEVLRGPQSGLYGADAIGGVIAITTKRGSGPPKVTGMAEGGSFGAFNQAVSLSGSDKNIDYAFNVLHGRTSSIPVTPLNLLAPGERRINDNYDNWTYSAKLGADVADDLAVHLIGRYTDAKLGFTGENFSTFPLDFPEALQSTQRNHNFYGRGEAVWSLFDGRFKNTFGVNYTNAWAWTFNPNTDFAANNGFASPLVGPPVTNVGERTKFDWRGQIDVAQGQTVLIGAEREKEALRTDSTGVTDAFFNFMPTTTSKSRDSSGAYAEVQSQIAKNLTIAANVRVDNYQDVGSHGTWRVAPAFLVPMTDTKLKGSYGTGFKPPTLTQLYVNNPSFLTVANPNLKPETSKGYDFGFEQPLLHDRVVVGTTYFRNDVRNLINNVFDATNFDFTYVNVGVATMHGTESFASLVVNEQLKLRVDYTTIVTRDAATGLGLRNRPGNKESLTAVWTPLDTFTLTATVLHVGSAVEFNRDGTVPRVDAPAYTLVNLAGDYKIDKNVTAFARIDNLFNQRYENPVGFDAPGFGVFGGVRVSYSP